MRTFRHYSDLMQTIADVTRFLQTLFFIFHGKRTSSLVFLPPLSSPLQCLLYIDNKHCSVNQVVKSAVMVFSFSFYFVILSYPCHVLSLTLPLTASEGWAHSSHGYFFSCLATRKMGSPPYQTTGVGWGGLVLLYGTKCALDGTRCKTGLGRDATHELVLNGAPHVVV